MKTMLAITTVLLLSLTSCAHKKCASGSCGMKKESCGKSCEMKKDKTKACCAKKA